MRRRWAWRAPLTAPGLHVQECMFNNASKQLVCQQLYVCGVDFTYRPYPQWRCVLVGCVCHNVCERVGWRDMDARREPLTASSPQATPGELC
jgi:hypothetical protein